jgi:outer membrane protein assembly factor BamB
MGRMGISVDLDGSVYVTTDDGLIKVDASGTRLWTVRGVADRPGPALIDADGTVFCSDGQDGHSIRAFDPDGHALWRFDGDEAAWHFTQPCLGEDRVLYAANWSYAHTTGYLYAITPEPATLSLLAAGLGAMWMKRRRKA